MKLTPDFYRRGDVVAVARDLLGKIVCSDVDGVRCRAVITETEAYAGVQDRASHAFSGRRTARTEPMFADGGCAYVYLCYGIHHLFNVVTGSEGTPHAVLIRAAEPMEGLAAMLVRRNKKRVGASFLSGPGMVAQALGIRTNLSGTSLGGPVVWIEDCGIEVERDAVRSGPRVGVDFAGDDAALPYRFVTRLSNSQLSGLAAACGHQEKRRL